MSTFLSLDKNLLTQRVESLRIPFENPLCPLDWKDWYHYILINPSGDIKILLNVCLNGRPGKGEIQLTIVVTFSNLYKGNEKDCTYGNVVCIPWRENMVYREPLKILDSSITIEIDGDETRISLNETKSKIQLNMKCKVEGPPLLIDENTDFGSGFIGWGFIPKLSVSGKLQIAATKIDIDKKWYCYHDRNFGRFHWGEDFGWEWIVINLKDVRNNESYQLVFDQKTNKNHSEKGFKYIFLFQNNKMKKIFLGNTLKVQWNRCADYKTPIRLPGTMASIFSNQVAANINSILIHAKDDRDSFKLELEVDNNFQLIVPDHKDRQYTFMEEVSGNAHLTLKLDEKITEAKGTFYGEFVR